MLTLAIGITAASCKPEVLPSSVSVSPSSVSMVEGETTILSVSVLPADAVYSGISWSSSDASVATVNNGMVTGVKAGSATITASADGIIGTATVTVNAKIIAVTGVSLDKTELELTEGDEAQLKASVAPDNATDKSVTWKSSDEKIATLSSDGKITAVAPGEATITVKTEDGNKTATCVVTVLENIDGALNGVFSFSATKNIRFSKGNLQAAYVHRSGVEYVWGFASHQYDYIGNAPGNTTISSQTTGAKVNLFGWSTSATNFETSTSQYDSGYSGDFVDWGKNIGNGSTWRTLTTDEWQYLFKTRPDALNVRKWGVTVCGKTNCVIIVPDDYTGTIASSYDASTSTADFVLLRSDMIYSDSATGRSFGNSVRLVTDVK